MLDETDELFQEAIVSLVEGGSKIDHTVPCSLWHWSCPRLA